MDKGEFLSLTLGCDQPRKRKRNHEEEEGYEESKIFGLLQMREKMLKIDHSRRKDGKGLHLIHLLLISATSIYENDAISALESLLELYKSVCTTGDSVQRVAAYFCDGLLARLLTRKSPFYRTVKTSPSRDEEFLAFTSWYKVSPFYQFAHFTANEAILEGYFREESFNNRSLHVVDFDVSYGIQWPSLMQSLSQNATPANRVFLRITGFGTNVEKLQETESRLVSFAKGYKNLVFEFCGSVRGSKNVKIKKRKNETVAVNLVFHLSSLNSFSKVSETLNFAHSLRPSVVVVVEREGSRSSSKFLPRFMESLHYYAAIFDSLDDCLPLESNERLSIEKNHLGHEIISLVNYDKDCENCPRFEKMEMWKRRMESHGFFAVEQSSKSVMQAKLLLKMRSHSCVDFDGFKVVERDDGKAVSLGWQQRFLVTASSWCCNVS